jgi:hypothetical protein
VNKYRSPGVPTIAGCVEIGSLSRLSCMPAEIVGVEGVVVVTGAVVLVLVFSDVDSAAEAAAVTFTAVDSVVIGGSVAST